MNIQKWIATLNLSHWEVFFLTSFFMPNWKTKDVIRFQKLYKHYYKKEINQKEAVIKIDALVDLIRLSIEYELSK